MQNKGYNTARKYFIEAVSKRVSGNSFTLTASESRFNKFCILGMLYSPAVLNLKLLVCICFQVVLFFTLSVPTESVQRALRMVVFLTQSVVDVFVVLWDFLS